MLRPYHSLVNIRAEIYKATLCEPKQNASKSWFSEKEISQESGGQYAAPWLLCFKRMSQKRGSGMKNQWTQRLVFLVRPESSHNEMDSRRWRASAFPAGPVWGKIKALLWATIAIVTAILIGQLT
jgi:hypothetical protein